MSQVSTKLAFSILTVLLAHSSGHGKERVLNYPETPRGNQVDTFHGVKVPDPYRWLEDDPRESTEVADWIAAENQLTRSYLDGIAKRESIHRRLTELWNYERYSAPTQRAGRYFFYKNDGLQNQAVLYVADKYDGEGRVLLDPNLWSKDGTVALGTTKVSEDGRYLAYGQKEAGSDWSTLYVMEIDTGKKLEESLRWIRFGGIVWNADSTGFYYNRYPEPAAGEQFQALATGQMLYFHSLGTPQAEDQLVYRRQDHPEWTFWLERTEDDRHLVLSISSSTDPQNQVHIRPADAPIKSKWTPLIEDFENQFWLIGNSKNRLFFLTDLNAPTKRIVAMDLDHPGREHVVEIVPAQAATLRNASLVGGKLVTSYLKDVVTQVKLYQLDGTAAGEITLPGMGSAHGFEGRQADTETFFSFTNYSTPTSIHRFDFKTGKTTQIRAPQINFDSSRYEVRQAFYTSKDGTRVPIMVTQRRGLPRDGQRPTLLYAYGGFNISITPRFSVPYAVWMEMGGIVAVPNLRGGGEYGKTWHQQGKALQKQNVFDDFFAAAEWLIAEKYTSAKKLAIAGGSNGGLLVGAVMTQRPDLFGACLPAVGVMDMLRYHQFTAGHFWREEYGTVDDEAEFHALLAYSPYHNASNRQRYPATLVTTADTDDRVVPMHSFKFGVALQHAQAGNAPILLRVETRAGHGAGTPISKRIDLEADRWAFLWKNLQMDQP